MTVVNCAGCMAPFEMSVMQCAASAEMLDKCSLHAVCLKVYCPTCWEADDEVAGAGIMRIIRLHDEAKMPTYATPGSVGLDLYVVEAIFIEADETQKLLCGIGIELPDGCEGQIRPRSSMSAMGLDIAIGTIDNDYRGEISVVAHNRNDGPLTFDAGHRIAQLVVSPIIRVVPRWAPSLSETERGAGGLGSTGR